MFLRCNVSAHWLSQKGKPKAGNGQSFSSFTCQSQPIWQLGSSSRAVSGSGFIDFDFLITSNKDQNQSFYWKYLLTTADFKHGHKLANFAGQIGCGAGSHLDAALQLATVSRNRQIFMRYGRMWMFRQKTDLQSSGESWSKKLLIRIQVAIKSHKTQNTSYIPSELN
jgi:hypothetical protein